VQSSLLIGAEAKALCICRDAKLWLQGIADRAADKGVTIGLEVVNRYETNVINTMSQGMELLADVDRPGVVLHLDSYHANIEELSMAAAVEACGDKLG
jgi:D-psicose/D-tagatose/L-ribulose 3-epimerase